MRYKFMSIEKQHLQQSQLAEMVGVRRETIGKLENGKYNPSLKLAMDIAKVFHVTVEDIFSSPTTKRMMSESSDIKRDGVDAIYGE